MQFILRGPNDPGGALALELPSNPEQFSVSQSPSFTNVNIDGLGEVRLPNGRASTVYSWDAVFYGAARAILTPLVTNWRPPIDIVAQIDSWVDLQIRLRQSLTLTITESNVNTDVWISNWSYKPHGGFGDIQYSLELVEARTVHVSIEGDAAGTSGAPGAGTVESEGPTPDDGGEEAPTPSTYIVQEGDYLIKIAKQVYGDSSRWTEIYDANRDAIGSDPGAVSPGLELQIPGGQVADVEPTTEELGSPL